MQKSLKRPFFRPSFFSISSPATMDLQPLPIDTCQFQRWSLYIMSNISLHKSGLGSVSRKRKRSGTAKLSLTGYIISYSLGSTCQLCHQIQIISLQLLSLSADDPAEFPLYTHHVLLLCFQITQFYLYFWSHFLVYVSLGFKERATKKYRSVHLDPQIILDLSWNIFCLQDVLRLLLTTKSNPKYLFDHGYNYHYVDNLILAIYGIYRP